jgi:hypothetical protein
MTRSPGYGPRENFKMGFEARLCCARIWRIRLPIIEACPNALASVSRGFSARLFLQFHRFAFLQFQLLCLSNCPSARSLSAAVHFQRWFFTIALIHTLKEAVRAYLDA